MASSSRRIYRNLPGTDGGVVANGDKSLTPRRQTYRRAVPGLWSLSADLAEQIVKLLILIFDQSDHLQNLRRLDTVLFQQLF